MTEAQRQAHDDEIQRTRDAIRAADEHPDTRARLQTLLDGAKSDGESSIACLIVDMRLGQRGFVASVVREAIVEHAAGCAGARGAEWDEKEAKALAVETAAKGRDRASDSRAARTIAVLREIPFRTQVLIAATVFSCVTGANLFAWLSPILGGAPPRRGGYERAAATHASATNSPLAAHRAQGGQP